MLNQFFRVCATGPSHPGTDSAVVAAYHIGHPGQLFLRLQNHGQQMTKCASPAALPTTWKIGVRLATNLHNVWLNEWDTQLWGFIHLESEMYLRMREASFVRSQPHTPGVLSGAEVPQLLCTKQKLVQQEAGVARAVCFNFGGGSQNPAPVKMSIQHIHVCIIDSDHAARKRM